MAQIHYFGSGNDMLEDPALVPGAQSWDTASVPVLFRGTSAQAEAAWSAGKPFPGLGGIYVETCEVTRSQYGFCWLTVRGRGIYGGKLNNNKITGTAVSTATREVNYPQEINGQTVLAPPKYATVKTGINAGKVRVDTTTGVIYVPERVRVLVPVDTADVSGLTMISGPVAMQCPRASTLSLPLPRSASFFSDITGTGAQVPYRERVWGEQTLGNPGWEASNFQPQFTRLGNIYLYEWRANYFYKHAYEP